jgi:hypothetical protein
VLALVGLGTVSLLGCIWDRQVRSDSLPARLRCAETGQLYGDALLEVDAKSEANYLILHQESLKELAGKTGLNDKEGRGQ